MPWAAAASVAGSLISSSMSSSNANQSAAIADPFASQRPQYQDMLHNFMSNPGQVLETPQYKAALAEGEQGVNRQANASGNFGSGYAADLMAKFAPSFAFNTMSSWESMLANLAGANIGSPGTAGSLYSSNTAAGNSALQGGIGSAIGGLQNLFGQSNYNNPAGNANSSSFIGPPAPAPGP